MKRIYIMLTAVVLFILANSAIAQVPVNIIYPTNGGSYPVGGGLPTGDAEYINASFSVTCQGGEYDVKWGFNGATVGSGRFYDQIIVQQTYKLPAGKNTFFVRSDCGEDIVKF